MKKSIKVVRDYLLIPIRMEEENRIVSFYHGDTKIYEFAVSAGTEGQKGEAYAFHYYAALPVREWKGEEIRLEGDVPENFLEAVALSDEIPRTTRKKPLVHMMQDTGWINDPNGMIYHDGVYHLFFQHNPCDTRWQNMSWGHAVSSDMLHWEQKEAVLFPDEDGTMFSGCGIVNEQGMLGLPRDAEIFFYTCAGGTSAWSKDKKFVQKIAYSTDGKILQKKGCVLENLVGENRDPKVYWHEEKGLYYMVLYLEKNEYAIFNSGDLLNWEKTQQLTLPNTWECPDLREVPVEGGGSKWMFWGADGHYFLGDFDGSHFETDGVLHEGYHTMLPYAAQSFWGTERVIMIPWMRTDNKGKPATSMMGMPRQLTLVKKGEDLILRQKLIDEFEESKEKVLGQTLSGKEALTYRQESDAALEVKVFPGKGAGFKLDLYGTVCTMEPGSGRLVLAGIAARGNATASSAKFHDKEREASEGVSLKRFAAWEVFSEGTSWEEAGVRVLEIGQDPESISFLSDGELLEITVDDGLVSDAYETAADAMSGDVKVMADGEVKVEISQIV